jgi:FtsP/CotA-like multicopper oxidase with cupredoxin domain
VPENGVLVQPFPPGSGDFPFSTINGKTGEAAGGPIEIEEGDRVRIRIYNASNLSHSMHLHGHDFVVTSKNGHPVPPGAQSEETTQNVTPGDFFEIEFTADNPGNWIFHCHVPHHTANAMMGGYNGAPMGMTRVFHYAGYDPVPPEYFAYSGSSDLPLTGGIPQ